MNAVMPVFIRGHPGVLPSILDAQPIQVLFHLEHGHPKGGQKHLQAALLTIATV
jgi:hypothetical protein